jgi:hypothetical protein
MIHQNIVHAASDMLQHPITYQQYNICILTKTNKLNQFTIKMLKSICCAFGLKINNKNRKKPFIVMP